VSADKDYLSLPLRTFLADLAAKQPTPGGGSVAAMVGAVAVCQARMVVAYTVGKERFAEHEERLRELDAELRRAEAMFSRLMTEDMAAFERWAAARKADDAGERQHAVATAAAVPMEIVVLAAAVAARLDEIKAAVNPYLLSDLQVAATLLDASAQSAAANARVNIAELADRKEADRLRDQLDMLVGRTTRHCHAVNHYQPE